jgi:hypothetical protein
MMMGRSKVVKGTVNTGTAAYARGDVIGGTIVIPIPMYANLSGVLHGVTAIALSGGSVPLDVMLFSGTFASVADNAAGTYTLSDMREKAIDFVEFAATDYNNFGSVNVASVKGVGLPFEAPGANLYAQVIARGTPTFAGTNDLVFAFRFLMD